MPYFEFQGKRIFYRTTGTGPLLAVLPGNTASSAAHDKELEYFSDRYRTVSIDFLGTGKSDRIREWSAGWWDEGSAQVAALIKHLEYEEAVLLGISGGAIIALATAMNYPGCVKAVVADSFALRFTEGMYANNVLNERSGVTGRQRAFWSLMHGPDWQDVVNADSAMIGKVVQNGGRCIKGSPAAIECPVLLTYSENDGFLPDVKGIAHELEGKIRKCEVKIFPNGDHPLIWTNPTAFFPAADEFLSNHG